MAEIKGKNTLGSREMFKNRTAYKYAAYAPGQRLGYPEAIRPPGTTDFWWGELIFAGKVSTNATSEPIEPYIPYMKSLKTKKTSTLALNFVVDAFKDFQREYLFAIRNGNLVADDPMLSDITAAKGYESIPKAYQKMLRNTIKSFIKYLNANRIINNIVNMDDFLIELSYYIFNVHQGPFTRSGFIMSRHIGPMSTGLCIDIQNLPYSEDEKKVEFINSPNFEAFRKIANDHGFAIDKNVPWRLVARIDSEKMIEYAQNYHEDIQTKDNIINKFFVQTAIDEIENLKLYLVSFYNQFVSENPRVLQETYSPEIISRKIYARSPITIEELNSCYSDCKWLELYIKIRNKETGLNYSVPAEKAIIRVAKDIQKTLDTREAMSYTKIKFSGVEFYEGSLSHEAERSRQRGSKEEEMTPNEVVKAQARSIRKIFF